MDKSYLKSSFQEWMKAQKKVNGEPYSPRTINSYVSALKNATKNLQIQDSGENDLFYYTSPEEFNNIHSLIIVQPNFDAVDLAAGNRAYSCGMALYKKFLEEQSQTKNWIFQGNPSDYNIIGAINDFDEIQWRITKYKDEIKKGDTVYIWQSGQNAGIVAKGKIITDPSMQKMVFDGYDLNDKYDINKTEQFAGDISIEVKLTDRIICKDIFKNDQRLKDISILNCAMGTNFKLTKQEAEVIETIINGTYIQEPVGEDNNMQRKYWTLSPGRNASKWQEFYEQGIIAIGWEELGDLKKYKMKDDLVRKLQDFNNSDKSFKNDALANWEFANEINIGDIIYAKKGNYEIIGRGEVTSNYKFDSNRKEYYSFRDVKWTHSGLWNRKGSAEGDFATKTLTNITPWPELYKKLEQLIKSEDNMENDKKTKQPLNQILYGPPGTGKTYHTKEILEDLLEGQVNVLNQQNYSNEDLKIKEAVEHLSWYEAIALAMYKKNKTASHKVGEIVNSPEILAYLPLKSNKNPKSMLWAMLQTHTGSESQTVNYKTRLEPFLFEKNADSSWYLTSDGIKFVEEELTDVLERLKTPKKYKLEDFYKFITFHQSYSYEEFIEGIKPDLSNDTSELSYLLDDGIFKQICTEAKKHPDLKYALVIDEINRGNISKIFGELITLIEDNKRIGEEQPEALEVTLPYSKEKFGVPKNLYLIGTMNTSDRSIASVDIALRRRFRFKEMMPKYSLIPESYQGVKLRAVVKNINDKISVLLDRDHQIGHSYFMQDKLDRDGLENVWFGEVMPLFNEYFFGEWDKLIAVLGLSTTKNPNSGFVKQLECPKGLGSEWLDENCYDFTRQGEDGFKFIDSLKTLEPTIKEGQNIDG